MTRCHFCVVTLLLGVLTSAVKIENPAETGMSMMRRASFVKAEGETRASMMRRASVGNQQDAWSIGSDGGMSELEESDIKTASLEAVSFRTLMARTAATNEARLMAAQFFELSSEIQLPNLKFETCPPNKVCYYKALTDSAKGMVGGDTIEMEYRNGVTRIKLFPSELLGHHVTLYMTSGQVGDSANTSEAPMLATHVPPSNRCKEGLFLQADYSYEEKPEVKQIGDDENATIEEKVDGLTIDMSATSGGALKMTSNEGVTSDLELVHAEDTTWEHPPPFTFSSNAKTKLVKIDVMFSFLQRFESNQDTSDLCDDQSLAELGTRVASLDDVLMGKGGGGNNGVKAGDVIGGTKVAVGIGICIACAIVGGPAAPLCCAAGGVPFIATGALAIVEARTGN